MRSETAVEPVTRTYRVEQNVTLSEIPAGAETVKWWIAIPGDDRDQDVLDFTAVSARLEMGYRLREPNEGKEVDRGHRCWVEYFVPTYGWVPADIVEADAPSGILT